MTRRINIKFPKDEEVTREERMIVAQSMMAYNITWRQAQRRVWMSCVVTNAQASLNWLVNTVDLTDYDIEVRRR